MGFIDVAAETDEVEILQTERAYIFRLQIIVLLAFVLYINVEIYFNNHQFGTQIYTYDQEPTITSNLEKIKGQKK